MGISHCDRIRKSTHNPIKISFPLLYILLLNAKIYIVKIT